MQEKNINLYNNVNVKLNKNGCVLMDRKFWDIFVLTCVGIFLITAILVLSYFFYYRATEKKAEETTFFKILAGICVVFGTGLALILFSMLTHNICKQAVNAISLADTGISTSARILEYKPVTGKYGHDYYLISYGKYKGTIELYSANYPINSNITVMYNKDNPSLVWLGDRSMGALELFIKNTKTINIFIILFVVWFWIVLLVKICSTLKKKIAEGKQNRV